MPIVSSGRSVSIRLTETVTYTGSLSGVVKQYSSYRPVSDSLKRVLAWGDPYERRVASPFNVVAVKHSSAPSLNAHLSYQTIQGQTYYVKHQVTGMVPGHFYTAIPLKTPLDWNRPALINNCLQSIQNESINLAMFFRELNQTMALISKTAKKITTSADAIRGNKFKKAAVILGIKTPRGVSRKKNFADNYLAFKFGVMPLIQDVDGAAKHLATRAENLVLEARSRIFSNEKSSSVHSEVIFNAGGENEFKVVINVSKNVFIFEQVCVEYQLANAYWSELSRLGFTNGGVATWESLPYSFVVDTFLNVGQWLGNMDLGLGLEFVTASYSQGRRITGTSTASGSWSRLSNLYHKYAQYNAGGSAGSFEDFLFDRSVLYEADMSFTLMFSSPLSVNNAINDSALVVQRLNRK